jgi:nitrous oxidase accessory protein
MRRPIRRGGWPAAALIIGCATAAPSISYGVDVCENCRMVIVDQRFGASYVTGTGRVHHFDSIEATVASPVERDTVTVSPDGLLPTITAALSQVRAGGVIIVLPGVYREPTIVVDRPVSILGRGEAVLDGEGVRGLLLVRADDVVIRGLRFRGVGPSEIEDRAAIRVARARGCRIEANEIDGSYFGIALAEVQGCRVAGNRIHGPGGREATSGNGIHLWSSSDITVEDNEITGHRDGIYLEFVRESLIRRNSSENNVRYGLHFMFSDDCRYENNTFRKNRGGVAVMYTRRVVMTGNRFEGNWGSGAYGLLLKEIADAEVRGNHFERNTTALLAEGANRLVAAENRFAGNGWAVRLMASSQDARLEGNDFIGNTFDVATNSRSAYSRLAGNYWDAYRGYDLDRDGTGDVPHRPVRLFSQIVERFEPTLVLQRSFLVGLLDVAEMMLPSVTPAGLVDATPAMRPRR